ncbi:hypothetical protein QSH18_15425 [Xanthomonas sp. NCPPB 2654]|uniref:hypothetical protein n=1 Tax=unclassified Xanthomonas TaxID=2643310 RepID=UPI0021E08A66|nr:MULTISPECIES: hypothetical protein [unclassified Xanthomonas]MDL5367000.1 hypothetical protein [Xanthomonas sp. NCPPB 2654]UYC21052.1 hypothetical protein NUG20_01740 [Xanthomonas sp. CFBP 8443]
MRRFLPCLILLLPLAAAHASDALASKQRNDCVYTDATDTDAAQARPAPAHPPASAKPGAAPSGGGGDSDLVPRLRMPKWHSFLPGMFR